MKINLKSLKPVSPATKDHLSAESGMATVIFIALLAIMMVLVMVESSSLLRLRREVKLLEQQQIKRLNGPMTSPVPVVVIPDLHNTLTRDSIETRVNP